MKYKCFRPVCPLDKRELILSSSIKRKKREIERGKEA